MKRRILTVFAGLAALLSAAALPPTAATAEPLNSQPGCLDIVGGQEGVATYTDPPGGVNLALTLTLRSAACPEDAEYRVVVLDASNATVEAPVKFTPSSTGGTDVGFDLRVPATHVLEEQCHPLAAEKVKRAIWVYATTQFAKHADQTGGPGDRAPDGGYVKLNGCESPGSASWN